MYQTIVSAIFYVSSAEALYEIDLVVYTNSNSNGTEITDKKEYLLRNNK